MKVLWICNQPLAGAVDSSGKPKTYGGGWLNEEAKALAASGEIEIVECFADRNAKRLIKTEDGKITHYAVPRKKHNLFLYDKSMDKYFDEIVENEKPDFCHIHGTENANALSLIRNHPEFTYVVSLQGIISYICMHEKAGVPYRFRKNRTVYGFVGRNGTDSLAKKHEKYTKNEKEIFSCASYFLGRTEWDKACAYLNNPKAKYCYNPRLLRPAFYENEWKIEDCEKHTVFVTQSGAALKGVHYVIKALDIVKKFYPDAKLVIAGKALDMNNKLKNFIKGSSYQQYLRYLLKKYKLADSVRFTGELDENGVIEQMKKSNVYVLSSSIDNSPNSLGEAMMMGVPCISSFVGGVPDMMTHKTDGFLYPYDEYYILAYDICKIFGDEELARKFSENAKSHAEKTHNRSNSQSTVELYKSIFNGEKKWDK